MFFYAWHWLHVFPHMTSLTCFSMLDTGYMFSHTSFALHVFLCLPLVTCFPTPSLAHIFSFLCLILVTCLFFHCLAQSKCQAFSAFPLVVWFAAGHMFSQAWSASTSVFWLCLDWLVLFVWLFDHMWVLWSLIYKTALFCFSFWLLLLFF